MRTIVGLAAIIVLVRAGVCSGGPFDRTHQLGFSVGTPSAVNAEYSREFGNTALYISGAYLGEVYGIQAAVSTVRVGTARKHLSLNIVAGHASIEDSDAPDSKTWTYGGAELFFRTRRFFVAPGLSAGGGSWDSPQLIARLGFTWNL